MTRARLAPSDAAGRIAVLAGACAALLVMVAPAAAYDFEPAKPLNLTEVDPSMLTDLYGAWEIRDASGKRRCRVTLLKDTGIGGYQIEVAPGCAKAFPVMDDIAAWRVNEGWSIDLVDALRKVKVRFETPDERYVAFGDERDIAGMNRFEKLPDRSKKGR
ncbi:MAG: AprI/Inh family metalloprotease inhibitor [Pseudolabrys sp.]